ncbi:ABC transporter ATP-binding protein [uncultured Arenimonas sp.]|uniref:ABC transporter ATP-binding protein n=1 Tax=uncultured Arenimonas sp. TaxID=546226 RepID=UPI0030D7EED1
MTARAPVIETRGLTKVYSPGTPAEVVALRGVDLRVEHGEFLAIMGASGSGKSTMMNLIGCLDTPTAGTYLCDGIDVASLDATGRARLRLEKIGFVFQGFNLLSRQTALENVMMPLVYAGVPVAEREPRGRAALDQVGLADRAGHKPNELSGGQEQRVAIARALVTDPTLLVCDEPTGDLDRKTADEILGLLQVLNREHGKTIIMVTHDPKAADFATHTVHLDKGLLAEADLAH